MRQTEEMKKEVTYWNQQYNKCRQARESFERQWLVNLSFYLGKQYVSWAPTGTPLSGQRLVEPPVPKNRVRVTANKIKPAIRRELTKLTKQEPQFFVKPATAEPTDVAAAKVGESIAEFYLHELKFNKVRRQATFWMLICGSAFLKPYITSADPTNVNVQLDAVSPFHLYVPDLQEEDIQKQAFVIHGRAVKRDLIEELYDIKIGGSNNSETDAKLKSALDIKNSSDEAANDMCFLKEIWVKPCKKYPDGGMLIIVNDELIFVHEKVEEVPALGTGEITPPVKEEVAKTGNWSKTAFPFGHGRYPFPKLDHVPSGKFYGLSIIEDLIPLQVEYNKSRSQVVEAANRMARPQTYYQKGSTDPNKITSEPGLLIPINPGFEYPREKELTALPSYVFQGQDRALQDMDELSGQTEADRGGAPPGIEAATAIAYLQEANDTIMYHTVSSIEEATSEIGSQILSLVDEFVPEEQIVDIVSKNNTIEVEQFKNKDFAIAKDFRVESGSMGPKSKAAQQAFITGLMEKGFIPPEKGLRYLQMTETDRLYEELQVDSKQAQREFYMISTGRGFIQEPQVDEAGNPIIDPMTKQPAVEQSVIPINIWDNHAVHEYEHALFLKSQEYELIEDPNIKQALELHYIMHRNELMSQMAQASQEGEVQNGSPDSSA